MLKTADQLKIKGLCEVPENGEGPSVSLTSPPHESGTPRLNFSKLKKHHTKYKRPRTNFEEPILANNYKDSEDFRDSDNGEFNKVLIITKKPPPPLFIQLTFNLNIRNVAPR